jgi:hypothetical protein
MSFNTFPAGEYIYQYRAVALNASGYAILADPFSADRSRVVGVSATSGVAGARVRVVLSDYIQTTNDAVGQPLYLNIQGSGVFDTQIGNVVSGYTEFYNPFYVTRVGTHLNVGVAKVEPEDAVRTFSPNTAILTEDQIPLIEYLVAEDGSKLLLENA